MINLRFHIVSLVAVFLALAIGIAVGATVVDQGLVGKLNTDIGRFDRQLRDRATTIDGLKTRVALAERLGIDGEERMIRDRLRTVPVLVVVAAGVAEEPVRAIESRLRQSGARVQGEVQILPRMQLAVPADYTDVRRALDAASQRPATLRVLLRRRLVDAIVAPESSPTIAGLVDAGFVGFRVDGRTAPVVTLAPGTRVVVLSGPKAALADSAFLLPFLTELALDSSARAVVGDIPAARVVDGAPRPAPRFVASVRKVRGLAARVSTVDDVDLVAGRLATVYALEDLAVNRTGHYGLSKDADSLLPAA